MRSSALAEFSDWFHQTRDMWMWAAIAVVALVVGLWWVGTGRSSPIRAAEDAVRAALNQPDVPIRGARLHDRGFGYRMRLVCGVVDDDPARPFAALVKERRRRSALSLIDGDRVRRLALPEIQTPTRDEAALLAACAARGGSQPPA